MSTTFLTNKPLRNRRRGQNTTIGEGMTKYLLDGAEMGTGISEYLDQVSPSNSKL